MGRQWVFDEKKVKEIARLANLSLSKDEIKKIAKDLQQTFNFISRVRRISTKGFSPTSHVCGLENVFREDKVLPSLAQQEALSGASSQYQNYFKIKPILEE